MLKIGFVGFGRMGITHFSILKSHPAVKVVGVVEQSKTIAGLIRQFTNVPTFAGFNQLIAAENVDALVISTPNDSHAELIEMAVSNGLHVFVEKPFVLKREDGCKILALLEAKPVVNQVGYVNRFNEVFEKVKKLLDTKILGEITNYRSEMYGQTVLKDSKGSWRGRKASGGGVLFDLGSHAIDIAVYLFGAPERVCGSAMRSVYSSEVEDFVCSTFVHRNGCIGSIRSNWSDESYRKASNVLEVFGTKGKLVADRYGFKLYLRESDKSAGFHEGWNQRAITDIASGVRLYVRGNEFTRQLDHFVECIMEGNTKNMSSFSDAFITDCLMEEIFEDSAGVNKLGASDLQKPYLHISPKDNLLNRCINLFPRRNQ